MDLVDLKDTFILCFLQESGWNKLLSDLPRVCEALIRGFYANVVLREDEINCWIRGHEFSIDLDDIDEVLGFEDLEHDFTHYKDRMLSIETIVRISALKSYCMMLCMLLCMTLYMT